MKKIAMFTMGTRGDVQPYIYLSKGLMKAGYDVTLGTHPCWKNLVESFGVHFEPVGPDIDIEEETSIIRGKSPNAMMSLLKTMNFIMKIIEGSSKEVYEICKDKDLIIVTHSQMGAVEAGVLGIPKVNVTLQTEMIGEKLRKQKFSEKIIGGFIAKQAKHPHPEGVCLHHKLLHRHCWPCHISIVEFLFHHLNIETSPQNYCRIHRI